MPRVTSCATLGYAAFGVEVAIERIAARGFGRVEITELGAYCRHYPYPDADPARIRAALQAHGLTPVAMNTSACRSVNGRIVRERLADPKDADRAVACAQWFLRSAEALGVGIVTFPIGPRLSEGDWSAEMRASARAYRRIADTAAQCGVLLNLEAPHLYQLTDSVEHVRAVFDEIDHPAVGATVDSSHWGIIGYDLDAFFGFLGPRLRHVHLRDSAGPDTGDFEMDLERTPGKGAVDFVAFGAALDRAGYVGDVSLEFEYRHTDLETIEQEFDAGIAHLKACGWGFPDGV